MRVILTVSVVVITAQFFIEAAKTADQRWCAISNQGAGNCVFSTIEQCREEVAGMGGYCMPLAPVGHRQPTTTSIDAARKAAAGNP